MPALTRRRDRTRPQECWRIYYGDTHVGTIAQCVGNKWQWRCGFYLGSEPADCTNGTAATFLESFGGRSARIRAERGATFPPLASRAGARS